ncbi:MAG: sigma-70 family RNA polymerase sigma factor [Bacteroidetes bacterium]|nr:sigma-70 family RNA polymerase sigma factor [Bacteroidota bacterium]
MTDQEILDGFKQDGWSREKAFNALVLRFRERLYRVIRGMVSSHEDTDDILQETFIKIYNNMHKFRGDSNLFTWVYRISVNVAISHRRKETIRRFFRLDDAPEQISKEPRPDETSEALELNRRITEAVKRLPEKQRIVFSLRFYDELSHEEISKITGNPVGTIKANFFHAMNKVKSYVENKDE